MSREYQIGFERGMEGKSSPYGLLEPEILNSPNDKQARQRGFEAGMAARGTAEAMSGSLKSGRSSDSTPSRSYDSFDKAEDEWENDPSNPSNSAASATSATSATSSGDASNSSIPLGGIAYLGVVAGAFWLIQNVATWSLVWWLCVLAILAGIPVYIAIAFIGFWVLLAVTAIFIVLSLIVYFLENLY